MKTNIVAELSANHGGSLETALETVRAAARAGADAIKIQTYTPDTMTLDCDTPPFQIHQGTIWDGTTLHKLYQEAFTPWEWHEAIRDEASRCGITFFSTPFDRSAVDFLVSLDCPIFKIASFEINDTHLIGYAASKGRPMILSTGVATIGDIQTAVEACRNAGNTDITLLKCTSAYPAPIEEANLRTIPNMAETFGVKVGLSDHTIGPTAALGAVAMGAAVVEKHFILDRSIGGPDASFSMEPSDFAEMCRMIRDMEKALGHVCYELSPRSKANSFFRRSLFSVRDIEAGESFTQENVRSIRPGTGLPPSELPTILGMTATRAIPKGTPLDWSMALRHGSVVVP